MGNLGKNHSNREERDWKMGFEILFANRLKRVAKRPDAPYLYARSTTNITMADDSTEEKVKNIIVEQLGVNAEQVVADAKFIEDLGADSLDTVELVMAFEEEFDIEVPDEDAEKLISVGDVVKYIDGHKE